jgi:hypothetical protein
MRFAGVGMVWCEMRRIGCNFFNHLAIKRFASVSRLAFRNQSVSWFGSTHCGALARDPLVAYDYNLEMVNFTSLSRLIGRLKHAPPQWPMKTSNQQ